MSHKENTITNVDDYEAKCCHTTCAITVELILVHGTRTMH